MGEKVCIYCGELFRVKNGRAYCSKCAKKLPLVRELRKIGRKIKAGANK